MYTIALDGCVEVQRALFPPVEISLVAQTVIAWTPDLHHHQQSLCPTPADRQQLCKMLHLSILVVLAFLCLALFLLFSLT